MTENIYRNFILDNSLAAISATVTENLTLATDGNNCIIHRFNTNGESPGCHRTLRPLRRLRNYSFNCIYTALGCCNERNLYFLDNSFNEMGLVRLEIAGLQASLCNGGYFGIYNTVNGNFTCGNGCSNTCNGGCGSNTRCNNERYNGCGCSCTWTCGLGNEPFSELTDASLTQIGGETYIIGVFPRGAYLFDLNGNPIEQLCTTEKNEVLTDFIHMPNGIFAMSTLCGNIRTITVFDKESTQSGILDRSFTLRMLIPINGEIYGLFGQNYIYNRIIKIYDGRFNLPKS